MADYWKSNPRKFCEFCKCWFADNKSSIDFHERGKRHKENVEKKITELRKKGQEQHATQQELGNFLKQMEEGAMKAFKKDVSQNPNLVPEYKVALVEKSIKQAEEASTALSGSRYEPGPAASQAGGTTTTTTTPTTSASSQGQSVWLEGISPEGYTYYWNTITGESQWEKPADFKPPQEKSSKSTVQTAETSGRTSPTSKEGDDDKSEEKEDNNEATRGVKRRHDAYGGWTSIATEEPEPVDLQLPEANPMYMSSFVPQAAEFEPREKLTIKEKTVGSIGGASDGSANVSFKKRKAGGRQIRQRDTTS